MVTIKRVYKFYFFEHISLEETNNCLILLNLKNGEFYESNETGKKIIELIKQNNSFDSISANLKQIYSDYEENDLNVFLKGLIDNGFIYIDKESS